MITTPVPTLLLEVIPPEILAIVRAGCPGELQLESLPTGDLTQHAALLSRVVFMICTGNRRVDDSLLDRFPNLRLLYKWGAGVDTLDLPAIRRRGIQVARAAGVNATAVAEHVIMLMLAMVRNLNLQRQVVQKGDWQGRWQMRSAIWELRAKTVGLIGAGPIALETARRLQPFGVRLLYNTRTRRPPALEAEFGLHFATLEEVLAESDIISLHCALVPTTRHLIGAAELKQMKPTAILINTARGGVVNSAALTQALQEGWIAGAGLDTFDPEPPDNYDPILRLPNLVMTPHVAGMTLEGLTRNSRHIFNGMLRYLHGDGLPEGDLV